MENNFYYGLHPLALYQLLMQRQQGVSLPLPPQMVQFPGHSFLQGRTPWLEGQPQFSPQTLFAYNPLQPPQIQQSTTALGNHAMLTQPPVLEPQVKVEVQPVSKEKNQYSSKEPNISGTSTNDVVGEHLRDEPKVDPEVHSGKEDQSNQSVKKNVLPQLSIVTEVSKAQEIEEIIHMMVNTLGSENENQVAQKHKIMKKLPDMLEVQNFLSHKFAEQKKSREEIIKFIMRKAFKFLFKSVQSNLEENVSLKKASNICMDHYFKDQQIDSELMVLPFRKNCKIKTMNSSFLYKVFSSPKFVNDYKVFLGEFDELILNDNKAKISKISHNIAIFLKKNQLKKIKNLRRMPWTLEKIKDVKQVAEELLQTYTNQASMQEESSEVS